MHTKQALSIIRLAAALVLAAICTVPLALAQAVVLKTGLGKGRRAPRLWHTLMLRILKIRVHIVGEAVKERPLLIAANHVSWTDIMVLGSLADIHFIAKTDVRDWPVMGTLAGLQRSIFVERERRRASPDQAREIADRLADGDPIVLFAEGTTGDGNRVLPFKSTLFGAAQLALGALKAERVLVQPVAIAYMRRGGLPLDRRERGALAWIGDVPLFPHLKALLGSGPVDVEVRFGAPIPFSAESDRKTIARAAERAVKDMLIEALRRRGVPRKAADEQKPAVI